MSNLPAIASSQLPAVQDDVFRPATPEEMRVEVAKLNALRPNPEVDPQAAAEALDEHLPGVSHHGLCEAIRRIIRGSLGHDLQPSPTRLLIEIDKVMRPHHEQAARAKRFHWEEDDDPRERREFFTALGSVRLGSNRVSMGSLAVVPSMPIEGSGRFERPGLPPSTPISQALVEQGLRKHKLPDPADEAGAAHPSPSTEA